jgi:hypothetical protein
MIRELFTGMTTREQRVFRWSAAAVAAALWLSTAWADPKVLLTVPVVGAVAFLLVRRGRRSEAEQAVAPDDDDWAF